MIRKTLLTSLLILPFFYASSQNNRLTTHEDLGWYGIFGTFRFSPKTSLHTEFQWRRDEVISAPQQNLLRLGINYHISPSALFRFGYALVETYPYGEIPLNGLGRQFTEHRVFQALQLSHKESRFDFTHRLMLEQRFIGRYSSAAVNSEDEFPLMHRGRYMFRVQTALKGREIKDRTPYVAVYDEIFIGFGKNVNANVFDQNRLGAVLGYRFSPTFRLEAGYMNQVLQFGRYINGQPAFQNNDVLLVTANFNFDLRK